MTDRPLTEELRALSREVPKLGWSNRIAAAADSAADEIERLRAVLAATEQERDQLKAQLKESEHGSG